MLEAGVASALSEKEFGKAIEGVDGLVRRTLLDDGEYAQLQGDWEDVRVVEDFGTKYLRIAKHLALPLDSPASHSIDNSNHEDHHEILIEDDDDPEALVIPVAAPEQLTRKVLYDVVHSPSYSVPVLYLMFADTRSGKSIPLPSPDEVYNFLVPNGFKAPMLDVGVMGALSMAEHPLTGMPAYFVHPCRTQEVMAPLLEGREDPKSNAGDPVEYLMLWLGVIGASVGLNVPVRVAKEFAEKRGEASEGVELGRC